MHVNPFTYGGHRFGSQFYRFKNTSFDHVLTNRWQTPKALSAISFDCNPYSHGHHFSYDVMLRVETLNDRIMLCVFPLPLPGLLTTEMMKKS